MEKTVLTFLSLILFGSLAVAQQHRCGTTEYYDMRYRLDPALQQGMAEEEVFIQQWIKDHPQPASVKESAIHFPELPGFQPTGDDVKDREAYKAAKEAYCRQHPVDKPGNNLSEEELEAARLEHKVTLVPISHKSK
jgi:hypothetical protein